MDYSQEGMEDQSEKRVPMMMMHSTHSQLQQMELQSTRFQGTTSLEASGIGCTDTQNKGSRIMQAQGTAGYRQTRGAEDPSCWCHHAMKILILDLHPPTRLIVLTMRALQLGGCSR